MSGYRLLKAVNGGPSISVSKSWLYVRHIVPGVFKCGERRFMAHSALKQWYIASNELSLEHDWVRTQQGVILSNNEHGIVGIEYE